LSGCTSDSYRDGLRRAIRAATTVPLAAGFSLIARGGTAAPMAPTGWRVGLLRIEDVAMDAASTQRRNGHVVRRFQQTGTVSGDHEMESGLVQRTPYLCN
jgi:hypothetical protein